MKKQTQFVLLLLSIALLGVVGCKKENLVVRKKTTFTLVFTASPKELSFEGYFTASGGVTTSGTCTMDVTPVSDDSIHCTQTLFVPDEGTITILSKCSFSHNTGAWYINKTTGRYANLRGEGTLTMSSTKDGPVELMKGLTWRE
jgi:hypothetical protein